MTKKISIAAILFSICMSVYSQTTQVNAQWKVNEKKVYHASYNKFSVKENDSTLIEGQETDLEFTVLKKESNGYTLSCVYSNIQFPKNLSNDTYRKLAEIFEGMNVQYETDKDGKFVKVLNKNSLKKDLMAKMQKVMQTDSMIMLANVLTGNKIEEAMEAEFDNGAFEISEIEEIRFMHDHLGYPYKNNEEITLKKKIGSPLTEIPIDCNAKITAKKQGDILFITEKDSIDKEVLINDMYDLILPMLENMMKIFKKDLSPKEKQEVKTQAMEKAKEEFLDVSEIITNSEIDSKTGWLNSVKKTLHFNLKDGQATSIIEIERK
ncbi:MAG: hypothetical protein M0P12_01420 [Paludibacteraceae bacterium]|nr:hypothetical protein [Paludibacteraceae bacterium]